MGSKGHDTLLSGFVTRTNNQAGAIRNSEGFAVRKEKRYMIWV